MIRVGIGGWTYAPWRDNFYPPGLVQRRELEYASGKLATIEVNGTFHRQQAPETYAKWAAATPKGFVFSAKAPMRIVNAKRLAGTGRQVGDFLGGLVALGDRLGPVVWQFERTLDRADFAAFLALLPAEVDGYRMRHVLDMRDPAFFDADYLALARRHRCATVFTDSPDHPSFADVTGDFVYARLMRTRAGAKTGYGPAALDAWARRARTWAAGGEPGDLPRIGEATPSRKPRDVFVYFIAGAKERNPAAAMALARRLARPA